MKSPSPHTPPSRSPRRWASCIAAVFGLSTAIAGAFGIEITGSGSYSQNFDTLPTTGSTNTWIDNDTVAGWYASWSTLIAGTGTGTTGALYSFGASASTERALGSLVSNTTSAIGYGVLFQNNSGSAITIDSVAYTGEQWRTANNTTPHQLLLAYQRDVNPITTPATTTGWTDLTDGNFTGPIAASTASALDGNDAANRTAISISPGIIVANGEYIMIRWRDPDDAGTDHGLAIDDLTISWSLSSTPALSLSASPEVFAEDVGTNASTGTVSIPAALGADLEVSLSSSDTTEATVPATVTIIAGQVSATFPIDAIDDFLADGAQNVTLTATAEGYISAQFGITVEDDIVDAPISVTVDPASFLENAGPEAASGTVTIAQNTLVDLTVNLTSFNASVTVPVSVVIHNGTKTATFKVGAVDDSLPNGTRNVTIRATAEGYTNGTTVVQVLDDGDLPPASTLNPGDIAFVGFNADANKDLAFVALAPITAGDVIHFTDNEWNGFDIGLGGAFNDVNEGFITWTAPQGGVATGTVVTLNNVSVSTRSASIGAITAASGSFNPGTSGETIYAFQGSASVSGATGFLAVVANVSTDSILGTGLSASNAVYLPTGADIGQYTGSRSSQTTFSGYLALIANTEDNWISQDGSDDQSNDGTAPDLPFDITPFTLGTPSSNTFAVWIAGFPAVGDQTGFNDDFDNDGLANALENILGSSPAEFNQGMSAVVSSGGNIVFRHTLNADPASDLQDSYEWSTDLVNWQASGASAGGTTVTFGPRLQIADGPPALVEVAITVTGTTPTKVFARLRVDQGLAP